MIQQSSRRLQAIIGMWDLISIKRRPKESKDESNEEYWDKWRGGSGILVYTEPGFVSVHLSQAKENRPNFNTPGDIERWGIRKIRKLYKSFDTYFGGFKILDSRILKKEKKIVGTIAHKVKFSSIPNRVDHELKRNFELSDLNNKLRLTTQNTFTFGSEEYYLILDWQRVNPGEYLTQIEQPVQVESLQTPEKFEMPTGEAEHPELLNLLDFLDIRQHII